MEQRQSQMAYCRENNIGYHVFHYWYKRYRSEHPANTSSPFVPLQIEAASTACIELIMPNGKRSRLRRDCLPLPTFKLF